ncbi:inorganic phosphate transporter [bacterium]|nr:inorganic phosphate transporter [bacterium]
MSTTVILFFLSSGLFLGWSLGANDAANVFGTAVGSRMIKFSYAALICSIFVIAGAVFSGAGATHTLGKLGAINSLAGAFTVALSSAITVLMMTKASLPVSTSQAIVGAIIGWNLFSGHPTDVSVFTKIAGTWLICPLLAMAFALIIYLLTRQFLKRTKIHLLKIDSYTRFGLVLVGAFGSYSLGANNIANVMGVFVPSSPFRDFNIGGFFCFSSAQQLFLLGGMAISIGVFTYSRRVMSTVGSGIFKLSPITALIVILASSLVLFLFASKGLANWMISVGLPPIPLVPVSSSQAVVGAIIGIGLAKGAKNVNYGVLGKISLGWIATPIIAAVISFVALFFMQNVFQNTVYLP